MANVTGNLSILAPAWVRDNATLFGAPKRRETTAKASTSESGSTQAMRILQRMKQNMVSEVRVKLTNKSKTKENVMTQKPGNSKVASTGFDAIAERTVDLLKASQAHHWLFWSAYFLPKFCNIHLPSTVSKIDRVSQPDAFCFVIFCRKIHTLQNFNKMRQRVGQLPMKMTLKVQLYCNCNCTYIVQHCTVQESQKQCSQSTDFKYERIVDIHTRVAIIRVLCSFIVHWCN